MAGVDLETEFKTSFSGDDQTLQLCFTFLGRVSVGESPRVQFYHFSFEKARCMNLFNVGIDEEADANACLLEAANRRFEFALQTCRIEASLCGNFFTMFGNQADESGAIGNGDVEDA